jgi:hypothetical protein
VVWRFGDAPVKWPAAVTWAREQGRNPRPPGRAGPLAGRPSRPPWRLDYVKEPMTNPPVPPTRRVPAAARRLAVFVPLLALLTLLGGLPAAAEPGDEEAGAPATLLGQLELTSKQFLDAQAKLDASKARQVDINNKLQLTQARLAVLRTQIGSIADVAYRGHNYGQMTAVLNTKDSTDLLRGMTLVGYLAESSDRKLRDYANATRDYAQQQKSLDAEVQLQAQQTGEMQKARDAAQAALNKASNGGVVNGVPVPLPTASPAPRNKDGSLSPEACTIDDPTTNGCITARTLHALQEAQKAGFNRFVGCHRDGDRFEHPKGRACDFSVTAKGFVDRAATGDDRNYGDRLAGWLVGNADRLGIMYVIFFRIIWTPAAGWHHYEGSGGAAAEHTNHVHMSIL